MVWGGRLSHDRNTDYRLSGFRAAVAGDVSRDESASRRVGEIMTITRATPADAGCYVDGHWGHYAVARMVHLAVQWGYDDAEAVELASRHLDSMFPANGTGLTNDEFWEGLSLAADDAEAWLNDHVAPQGHMFGWYEGEFFLQSVDWWNEDSQL